MTEEETSTPISTTSWPEWRRLKKSAHERFEEPFLFDIGGQTIKIIQDDIGYEHNLAVGLTVWDAALVLSKYLETLDSSFLKGKRVIELGSGTGISGICAAVLGGLVTITDVPWLVNFIKENLQLPENISAISSSNQGGSVEVRELSWKSTPEAVLEYLKEANIRPYGKDFDVIIAADVIYTNEAVPMLLTTIWMLAGEDTKILLAGEQHNPGSYRVFHEIVDNYFSVEEIAPSKQHSVYQFHPTIRLWSLRKKVGTSGPFPELNTNG